jgi:hypothetical protein
LTVLLSALWLTGCGNPVPALVRADYPAALLTCDLEPPFPDPLADDSVLASYVLDLRAAGAMCRERLDALRNLLTSGQ